MTIKPLHAILCAALAAICSWSGRDAALHARAAAPRDERERSWAEWIALSADERDALLAAYSAFKQDASGNSTVALESARRLRMMPRASEQRLRTFHDALLEFTRAQPRSVQTALARQPPEARAAMLMRLLRESGDELLADWRRRFVPQ